MPHTNFRAERSANSTAAGSPLPDGSAMHKVAHASVSAQSFRAECPTTKPGTSDSSDGPRREAGLNSNEHSARDFYLEPIWFLQPEDTLTMFAYVCFYTFAGLSLLTILSLLFH